MQDTTYGEYQEEMNMLNKALLEVLSEGDANGRVFTFPIPTVNITKDFNWDNPVIESLWEASAKYGIPYFSNFINLTWIQKMRARCAVDCVLIIVNWNIVAAVCSAQIQ